MKMNDITIVIIIFFDTKYCYEIYFCIVLNDYENESPVAYLCNLKFKKSSAADKGQILTESCTL